MSILNSLIYTIVLLTHEENDSEGGPSPFISMPQLEVLWMIMNNKFQQL